ncbi:MAG: flagellar biosynthesis anti-sigma factor FlgM [Sphingomonas sp.]|uniref:flagellar biosynthesis anti-sigma factor FlgM n=1 Tax=Sphingomonas sp. TaxID=28214 RepID=UPI001B110B64|nr:flagellar biosynthesis anti-sigma factor FlgM [Sphingomonas sp.]MBO9622019.1 flagellar biosynthesis anti-sigma factor FlgM [Sphingomonas sp.]
MVDPIGIKAGAVVDRGAVPMGASGAVAAVQPVARPEKIVESMAAEFSGAMASGAPVDGARVVELRAAIRAGRFTVSPQAIAERMLAMKQDWSGR